METPLYIEDSYAKECRAKVVSANKKFIVLDKNLFYPKGGGQEYDTGTITRISDGQVFKVVFTGKFNGKISHEVDKEGLKEDDEVECKLDWERRYKLMKMHSAAHVISAIIHNETGALISGNQLGVDKSRIDFSVPEFDREKLQSYEDMSNKIIEDGIEITTEYMARDDVLKNPSMTKLAKGLEHLPASIKIFRILKIGDLDLQADGGTHVKNTREIGRIKFVDFINKGAKNRRIYFVLE